jgi:hypothetical protein
MSEGVKHDDGKPRMDLVSTCAMEGLARVAAGLHALLSLRPTEVSGA